MRFRTHAEITYTENLLDLWRTRGGYYKCPEGPNGQLLGPLVGYAGTYGPDGDKLHFVGKEYYNFAKVEENYELLDRFVYQAIRDTYFLALETQPTVILAAPMGGIKFGDRVGAQLRIRSIFAEKKVTKAAQGNEREESVMIMNRHEILPGDRVLVAEDVVNNFSATNELYTLIRQADAWLVGIICALNRNEAKLTQWHPSADDAPVPVISAVFRPTPQYRQDQPEVWAHIPNNVVWKPKKKDEWARLEAAMAAHA
jgi:adenine/guanine phosphoribosyltransferase-like PRPP-binding protein